MPRSSGTYTLPTPENPVVADTVIDPDDHNTTLDDIADALTASLAKDGQTTPTADLPMGGFKHTGAAAGTATGQYLVYDQTGAQVGTLTVTGATTQTGLLSINGGANLTPATTPATNSVGYLGTPVVDGNSAYGLLMTDAGKTIYHNEAGARTWTIPANASIAFPIGTVIILDNTGNAGAAGIITLAITTDTLRRGDGTAGTGSRTIPASAVAAIRKVAATEWVITGVYT